MASKKIDFLAQAKALPPSRSRIWFDDVTPAQERKLLLLKQAFAAGDVKASKAAIWKYAVRTLKLDVKYTAFCVWLGE